MDAGRLAAFPVFAELPAAELDEVAGAMSEVEVDAGSTVTTVDNYGAAIYFVEQARPTPRAKAGTQPRLSARVTRSARSRSS